MAKFHGIVGYIEMVESKPGIWTEQVTERTYSGDVLRNASRSNTSSDSVNDDLNINNQISVLADPYAYQHFMWIKYIEFMGAKWKVTSVDVQYPRLILNVGGLYTNAK